MHSDNEQNAGEDDEDGDTKDEPPHKARANKRLDWPRSTDRQLLFI